MNGVMDMRRQWQGRMIGFAIATALSGVGFGASPPAQAQSASGFLCDETGEFPTVVAVSGDQRINFITFTSDWAPPPFDDTRVRCNQVAAKFQRALIAQGNDVFEQLTFSHVNNQPVLCIPSTPIDQHSSTCQASDVLITFQNERQGCLFVPAFLQNLMQQGAGDIPADTDFEAMREFCTAQFPNRPSGSSPDIRDAFRSLNP